MSVIFLPVKQTPPAGWMSDTQVLTRIPYSLVISYSSPASYHELNYREEMEPQIRAAGTSNSNAAAWSFILPRASTFCCRILSCSLWQLLSSSAGEQRPFPACLPRAFPWASGFPEFVSLPTPMAGSMLGEKRDTYQKSIASKVCLIGYGWNPVSTVLPPGTSAWCSLSDLHFATENRAA